MDQIKYTKGYKYQLAYDYSIQTEILGYGIDLAFVRISKDGLLDFYTGYAWDGASGPTIDTKSSMRGSLVHDGLYQLMRSGYLPLTYRRYADSLLQSICKEDGMWPIRANLWFVGVKDFAASAADPKNRKKIITAP